MKKSGKAYLSSQFTVLSCSQVNQHHKESSPFRSELEKSISSDPLANVRAL